MRRLAVVVFVFAAAVAAGMTSCKQGDGDRCQVQSDCSGGLICNQATGTCQSTTSGADGNISPDARVDGGPDAAADAAVDADTTPDA